MLLTSRRQLLRARKKYGLEKSGGKRRVGEEEVERWGREEKEVRGNNDWVVLRSKQRKAWYGDKFQ